MRQALHKVDGPEFNLDEYLNPEFKTRLRLGDGAQNKSTLLEKADCLMGLFKETPQLVKAYFKHSAVCCAS